MSQYPSVQVPPRLPLVVDPENRDTSTGKDARLVNCYMEVDADGSLWIYKRPGLASFELVANDQLGRGVFQWRGDLYSIFADELYRNGISVATGLDETNGVYRFDEILGATPKMVLGNGNSTYAYTVAGGLSAELNTIDPDFPVVVVKGFSYLNGPIYVMQPEAVIWGSAVNSVDQPGDWDPLNFIRAQIEPDDGVAMNKQLVYVIALKQWSTEVFFDAGNVTGSPLGPVQGSKSRYGCANADSVQRIDDVLFWLSINQAASLQVARMNQLSVELVSTPAVDRLLSEADITGIDVVYSWQLKMNGHSWYILTVKDINLTLAYDITQNRWWQWTDLNGDYFPIVSSTYGVNGEHVLQHETNGRLLRASSLSFTDLNDPITVDIITPSFDAQTRRRKQLNMFEIIGDQVEGSIMQVRNTDDDYQTWSQWRTLDLSAKRPFMINCGTFVKRAYHLRHSHNTHFRIQAVEVQYDVGTL